MKTSFKKNQQRVVALAIIATFLGTTGGLAGAGDLDTTFGTGGKVFTDFGNMSDDWGHAIAIQTDGKIIMAGDRRLTNNSVDFALARYNRNGSLDKTFDADGKVTTNFGGNDNGEDIAIQPDGKIIVAGNRVINDDSVFAIARYNRNGSLDTTFNTDGKVTTGFDTSDADGYAVALQSDGKIIVAGYAYGFALARYNRNGSLDKTFGTDGKVTTRDGLSLASDVAIQSDGKIILAGWYGYYWMDFGLARYNTNGSLDTTFGSGGIVHTDIGGDDFATAIAIQSDGKIIVVGYSRPVENPNGVTVIALARYNSNGSLDTTFDDDGLVTTDFGADYNYAFAIVTQPDGKIVVAGRFLTSGADDDMLVARYNQNGSLDKTFGTGGKVIIFAPQGWFAVAESVALQSDGKIVVGGSFDDSNYSHSVDFGLARLNADLPKSVDYSLQMPPVGDQGKQGSCAAWAVGYYYKSYQENKEHHWGYNYEHLFSPSYIYNQLATSNNGLPNLEIAFNLVKQQGVAPLSEFVYNQKNWVSKPTEAVKNVAAAYKALNYKKIYDRSGLGTVKSLKEYLADYGPFVMGIPLYTGIQFNGWNIKIIDHVPSVIDIPSASLFFVKDYRHAVLIVGYNDTIQRFKFINSWGPTWGDNGFGYITYGFVIEQFPFEAYGMADALNDPVAPTTCFSAPPRPALIAPPDSFISTDRRVFLDWFARCARTFEVKIKLNSAAGTIVDENSNVPMSQYWTIPLTPGETYFWHVRACNAMGCSPWSPYLSFKLSSIAALNRNDLDEMTSKPSMLNLGSWNNGMYLFDP